jgi:inactivated superfamily I helicase
MSGFEAVAAIIGVVAASAECIKIAIAIYKDVKDTSKVPPTLQKVAARLSIIKELLDNAQHEAENKRPNANAWQESEACLLRCEKWCRELQSLFEKAFPQQPDSTRQRFWKSFENVVTSKGRKAEELFKDIYKELEFLSQQRIVTSHELLQEIRSAVDDLGRGDDGTFQHFGSGAQNINKGRDNTINSLGEGSQFLDLSGSSASHTIHGPGGRGNQS